MQTKNPDSQTMDPKKARCVFCGKTADEVAGMIQSSDGTCICDECILYCTDVLARGGYLNGRHPSQGNMPDSFDGDFDGYEGHIAQASFDDEEQGAPSAAEILAALPTPHELFDRLSQHVVGQEAAKRALSVAVYNHYKRISLGAESNDDDVELAKSNIMLLGPTGSGKTLLAQTLARTLQVPFAIADATTLTGEGVQQALLKIVEGTEASVPPQGGRKHPQQELIHIDTTNILFILGGAFVGLADIIGQRVGKKGIGFTSDVPQSKKHAEAELLEKVLPEDLNKFGMIPEFVGRIPVICSLDELTEDDLVHILTDPKNALVKQYVRMFEFENSELVFTPEALRAIAHEAVEHGTGARGLRAICERVLQDVMFDLPEHAGPTRVVIRPSDIEGETKPEIEQVADAAVVSE